MTMVQSLKATLSSRAAVLIYAASAVRFFGGYTIAAFMPLFFKTYYPDSVASYGLANALCVGIGGIISSYGGGVLADRWSATNARGRMWIPAVSCVVATLASLGLVLVPTFASAMALLAIEYILAECWFGPALSALQYAVPQHVMGFAAALFVAVTSVIGSIAPPLLAGIIELIDKPQALRWVMFGGIAFSYLLSGALFAAAALYTRRRIH